MVRYCIVLLFLICAPSATSHALQQSSFAILPMEASDSVTPDEKTEAESVLTEQLSQSGKYRLLERVRIEQILSEKNLQLSGLSDSGKASVGRLLGVDKLISAVIFREDSLKIRISVIDVPTARVEFTKVRFLGGYGAKAVAKWAAAEILMRYPLLGAVKGISGNSIIVDLGEEHGVKKGSRIFVAEKTSVLDDSGRELLSDFRRIGVLEVSKAAKGGSQTSVKQLQDKARPISTADIVSLEPIPSTEPVISRTPLLSSAKQGRLVLDDDMQSRKYLSAAFSKGEDYVSGTFHLNASERKLFHAHAFYPMPFDRLTDFIFQGEIEFRKQQKPSGGIDICFRSNGPYSDLNAYRLHLGNNGKFEVKFSRYGARFGIIPMQATPLLHRGAEKNMFRIVAIGNKFDIYLNGSFLIAFEDETLDAGGIGFMVDTGGYVTVDNVKVWEAEAP